MPNYANAKATIAANIYTNHTGQVTAEMVKTAADEIVNTLIAGGYLYAGIAHPGDAAVSPDANVFYIASEPGTYENKGGLVVADGEVAIFKFNGTWSKEVTGAATEMDIENDRGDILELNAMLGTGVDVISSDASEWEQGTISGSGQELFTNARVRSKKTYKIPKNVKLFLDYPSTQKIAICYWDNNGTYHDTGWLNTTSYTFQESVRARFLIRKVGGTDIAPADVLVSVSVSSDYLPERVDRIEGDLYTQGYDELTIYSVLEGKYISNGAGAIGTLANLYKINLVDVTALRGQTININAISRGLSTNTRPSFGFYTSTELSADTCVSTSDSDHQMKHTYSLDIVVPGTASYLALVQEYTNDSTNFTSVAKLILQNISRVAILEEQIAQIEGGVIEYNKAENVIEIGNLFKTAKIGFRIGPGGQNGLVDFRKIYLFSKLSTIDSPIGVTDIISSVGDMHAPFKFRNDNLTDDVVFTGGNHIYDGVHTAELDYVRFYADGELISESNKKGRCQKILVEWSNLVKPGNAYAAADPYGLREIHKMSYDGIEFDEWIELIPLVDVRMGLWYALQLMPIVGQTFVMFPGGANRGKYSTSELVNSGDRDCNMLIAGDANNFISMWTDSAFDLGKRTYSIETVKGAFHNNQTGKSYFTVIKSDYDFVMLQDGHYFLHGKYRLG